MTSSVVSLWRHHCICRMLHPINMNSCEGYLGRKWSTNFFTKNSQTNAIFPTPEVSSSAKKQSQNPDEFAPLKKDAKHSELDESFKCVSLQKSDTIRWLRQRCLMIHTQWMPPEKNHTMNSNNDVIQCNEKQTQKIETNRGWHIKHGRHAYGTSHGNPPACTMDLLKVSIADKALFSEDTSYS